jgi:transposase
LVNVDRETPMLLPPDLRQWVPDDDLVHFIIEAVDSMELPSLSVNTRGTGSPQYPPRMMMALVVYCYANGVLASRRIERATYRDIAVRYLTGDTHPDHDTICAFRRNNRSAIWEAFVELLQIANQLGLVSVGTISVDGSQITANASKHKSVRYDRAGELERQLGADVDELLEEAEQADSNESGDDQGLPDEIKRREQLRERMAEARRKISERHRSEDEADSSGSGGESGPRGDEQVNLTDSESRLMRSSKQEGWRQAYNAQAVVDAEGSQLVLDCSVVQTPSDMHQLRPAVDRVSETLNQPKAIVADANYCNAAMIEEVQRRGTEAYVAVSPSDGYQRQYDYRPPRQPSQRKRIRDPRLVAMREKLATENGKEVYAKRAKSVEPVFGVIKASMGLRQFLLRGLEKVRTEWQLACLAYNMKRLWALHGG